jgi:hypothetical protein
MFVYYAGCVYSKENVEVDNTLLNRMPYQIILRLNGARKHNPDVLRCPFGVSEKSTENLKRPCARGDLISFLQSLPLQLR